jgi:Tfp pilus assembly protein PilF
LVGWLCYFILLAPTLLNKNYSPSVAWDKYAYLPSLGILMILAWLLKWFWTGGRMRQATLGAIVLVVAAAEVRATRQYLDVWQNTESLYQYMLRLAPDACLLHNNYGIILGRQGKTEEAIGHFQQALRSNSDYADAHNNLGIALASQGKIGDAIPHLRRTLHLNPGRAEAHNNLGNMLAHEGQIEEAMSHYSQALQLKPDYVDAHINLGVLLQRRGLIDKAIAEYQEALRIDPRNELAQRHLQVKASQPMK